MFLFIGIQISISLLYHFCLALPYFPGKTCQKPGFMNGKRIKLYGRIVQGNGLSL
jgi:hypothetical protein